MKEVVLTGYSKREFSRLKGNVARCYICKRKRSDEGVYYVGDNDTGGYEKICFKWVQIIKGPGSRIVREDTKFKFFLCDECLLLMEAIMEKFESSKIFSEQSAGKEAE